MFDSGSPAGSAAVLLFSAEEVSVRGTRPCIRLQSSQNALQSSQNAQPKGSANENWPFDAAAAREYVFPLLAHPDLIPRAFSLCNGHLMAQPISKTSQIAVCISACCAGPGADPAEQHQPAEADDYGGGREGPPRIRGRPEARHDNHRRRVMDTPASASSEETAGG
jgi:hypothetical protein